MVHQMMKLISWNVKQGTGERLRSQVAALAAREPDIVALQEVTAAHVDLYAELLGAAGLEHHQDSFSLAADPSLLQGPRSYGQLVASRWPVDAISPQGFPVPWPERILSVRWHTPASSIELHTTHIPPGSSNGWVKI